MLTEKQQEEILTLYNGGMYRQRDLAEMYGVTRYKIRTIVNPEGVAKAKASRFKPEEKHASPKFRLKRYITPLQAALILQAGLKDITNEDIQNGT